MHHGSDSTAENQYGPISPVGISAIPNCADSAAIRKSQPTVMYQPRPIAKPLTAAIIGLSVSTTPKMLYSYE